MLSTQNRRVYVPSLTLVTNKNVQEISLILKISLTLILMMLMSLTQTVISSLAVVVQLNPALLQQE